MCAAWLNQCVGHHNHRYFFLFMCYVWLGCAYLLAVSSPLILAAVRGMSPCIPHSPHAVP